MRIRGTKEGRARPKRTHDGGRHSHTSHIDTGANFSNGPFYL